MKNNSPVSIAVQKKIRLCKHHLKKVLALSLLVIFNSFKLI